MAITVQLTDDTTTFDLVYDAASQPNYHTRKGLSVTTEDTDVLEHRPDNAESVPIRGVDRGRTLFLTKDVLGDTEDEVLDKIAAIKRMVDGEDQQALRYHTNGDVNCVKVKMKRGTATNYTYQIVKWGHVDDSGAHYTAEAQNSGYAIGILVTLHLTAHGEGAPITLRNDLPSSPHFLEDSNSDGLADGWSVVGTPTTNISTVRYLVGGQSQQIATDASTNEGIRSSLVTAPSGSTAVAYVWLQGMTSGGLFGNTVTVNLADGSDVSIQSKSFNPTTPTGYDKSYVDSTGTWYRYVVSGTNVNANFRLYISRVAANATKISNFVVDAAYLQIGTTTAPDAWCSTSAIYNRNDPVTANPERINYVDVWGVPGDSDAILTTNYNLHISNRQIFIFSRWADGQNPANKYKHWLDTAQSGWTVSSTGNTNGSWSSTASASYSNGSARRFTASGGTGSGTTTLTLTDGDAVDFVRGVRRAFLVASCSNTAVNIQVTVLVRDFNSSSIVNLLESDTVNLPATTNIYLLDLGTLDGTPLLSDDVPNVATSTTIRLEIAVSSVPNGATVDVDALFLPVASGNDFMILKPVNDVPVLSSNGYIDIFGSTQQVTTGRSAIVETGACGSFYTVKPGVMNRAVFLQLQDTQQMILDDEIDVSFLITPRTRHLLGTS